MSGVTSDYLPAAKVYKLYAVSRGTLRQWADSGKVEALRAGGEGKRLYKLVDIERVLGVDIVKKTQEERKRVCYARVSSSHQRADLDRQIAFLEQHYPTHHIYHDIGSGLNFKRSQFVTLLDEIYSGAVSEVVVTDKDRICRFGIDLVQWILDKAGTKLVVHSDTVDRSKHDEPDFNHELSDDIISIITFFTARSNGQRAARNRKRRRLDQETGEKEGGKHKRTRKTTSSENKEDSSISDL